MVLAIQLEGALTVLTDVPTIFIDVHEFSKSLDDVNILLSPGDDKFGTLVQAVVQHLECFQDVPPVLALVVQPLVQHVHYFVELGRPR